MKQVRQIFEAIEAVNRLRLDASLKPTKLALIDNFNLLLDNYNRLSSNQINSLVNICNRYIAAFHQYI
jgi:hypothetical protein